MFAQSDESLQAEEIHPSLLQRKILHVDMDAFYAAIEVRDDPSLKGRPVIIGGNPNSRAVVCTASYEARKFGVRSAMPCSQAARLCPEAIFLKPSFEKYRQVSLEIREIFLKYTSRIEPLSLDEAYLDVTDHHLFAIKIARCIQEEVTLTLHLSCSVGVAPNKLLAKIASDFQKPNGLTVVLPKHVKSFMENLPLRKINGIGPATEQRLKSFGFTLCRDLWPLSCQELELKLGRRLGAWLYARGRGIDERPVEDRRERKSIGKEYTFAADTLDLNFLHTSLENLCKTLSQTLLTKQLVGKTLTLKVKYSDFSMITRSITLPLLSASAVEFFRVASQLLRERSEAGSRKIRLLGVAVSKLESKDV